MDRLIILLFCLASCRTSPPPGPSASKSSELGTLLAPDEPRPPAVDKNLPEPSAQDLGRLHTWLASQETGFQLDRLDDCAAQLLLLSERVQNKDDILKVVDELQTDVRATLPLYHWCYFHMLSRLEYQLEQQNLGSSYQDKLQQFLRESKALFIVAECLDRIRQVRRYRSTLQKKYIALSQAWFGRSLSPIGPAGRPESRKPASPFEEQ